MVLSVELDLAGCDWWDGRPIELLGYLERVGAPTVIAPVIASACGVAAAEDGDH